MLPFDRKYYESDKMISGVWWKFWGRFDCSFDQLSDFKFFFQNCGISVLKVVKFCSTNN